MKKLFLVWIAFVFSISICTGQDFKALETLAEEGDQNAQVELGAIYLEGKTVKRDFKEAFKWFSKASKQDNIDAHFALVRCMKTVSAYPSITKKQ